MRVLITAILILYSYTSIACSFELRPMEVLFSQAQKVYRGTIITVKKITDEKLKHRYDVEAQVLTTEVFKGSVDLPEKIYTRNSSAACGFDDLTAEMIFFVLPDGGTDSPSGTFRTKPILAEGSFMYDLLKTKIDNKLVKLYQLREIKN